MAERKCAKEQTVIYKSQNRKLKIEQQETWTILKPCWSICIRE